MTMTVREEVADAVLESQISRTARKEEREADLMQNFEEMPSFLPHDDEPDEPRSCARRMLAGLPWLTVLVAYIAAQAFARGVGSVAVLTQHLRQACLDRSENGAF